VPAAAVIPAPIAYIKVAAVKKLVVGFWVCLVKRERASGGNSWLPLFSSPSKGVFTGEADLLSEDLACSSLDVPGIQDFYFEKIRVFKAGLDA
jgi:hypothetical protein